MDKESQKIIFLFLSLLGISLLFVFFLSPVKNIDLNNLNKIKNNERVNLIGKVIEQKSLGKLTILKLNNTIEVQCFCNLKDYKDKYLKITALSEKYKNKTLFNILEITQINIFKYLFNHEKI